MLQWRPGKDPVSIVLMVIKVSLISIFLLRLFGPVIEFN